MEAEQGPVVIHKDLLFLLLILVLTLLGAASRERVLLADMEDTFDQVRSRIDPLVVDDIL